MLHAKSKRPMYYNKEKNARAECGFIYSAEASLKKSDGLKVIIFSLFINIHSFFIRTNFIRTSKLRFEKKLTPC